MRTKAQGGFHGHGRMDPEAPGFVTAGSDDTAVTIPTYQNRFSDQFGVDAAFDGHEKGIQVEVDDMAGGGHAGAIILKYLVLFLTLNAFCYLKVYSKLELSMFAIRKKHIKSDLCIDRFLLPIYKNQSNIYQLGINMKPFNF